MRTQRSNTKRKLRIFLSYARGDDETFVARLYGDLIVQGFEVWWDRVSMPSRGLTFLNEVRDTINTSDRFLLVLGPKAVTSDYVVAEWEHAIAYGKVINSILRLGDFLLAPDELRLLHIEDFRDDMAYASHLSNLIRQLSEPASPLGRLSGLPSLPRHVVTRSDHLRPLISRLLADLRAPTVLTGPARQTGMYGMGGIGKSVLATLMAHSLDVRRAFPDGIVWVPFGNNPNVTDLQRNFAKVLGDEGHFESVAQGRARLSELLESKAVLLVLDDVWERAHADAFNVLGNRCRVVITTRDAGLVVSLGAVEHEIQLFTESESLKFLADTVGLSPAELPPEASQIVTECNRLPLALALCGGMLKDIAWTSVLERLQNSALEFISAEHPQYEHHRDLWVAMNISVSALSSGEQERFMELSMFPEDSSVPEATIHTLWAFSGDLNKFQSQNLITKLYRRSLIRVDNSVPTLTLDRDRRISIHDLVHDCLVKLAGEPTRLHNLLLDAYTTRFGNDYSKVPDDGWFLQHLREHCIAAGKGRVFADLLLDLKWLERKNEAGLVFDLVEDFGAALTVSAAEHNERRQLLRLILQALRRDLQFIARHANDYPSALFQCLWNSCWWYDCKDLGPHYKTFRPESGYGRGEPEVAVPVSPGHEQTLSLLMESWRKDKERRTETLVWLRSLRPPPMHLCTALGAVFDLAGNEHVEINFSGDGSIIAAHAKQVIWVWEVKTNSELFQWTTPTKIQSVCLSRDGHRIAFATNRHDIGVVTLKRGQERLDFVAKGGTVTSISFSPNAAEICTGSNDGSVRIWSASSGKLLAKLKKHADAVRMVAYALDGARIISASDDWTVRISDVSTGMEVRTLHPTKPSNPSFDKIYKFDISLQAQRIGIYGLEGRPGYPTYFVEILEIDSGLVTKHKLQASLPRGFALSADGKQFALGDADWTITLFDSTSGNALRTFRVHSGEVHGVAFSPNGRELATQGGKPDTTIKIWDLTSDDVPLFLPTPWYGSSGIAFSSDGSLVLSDHGFEGTTLYDVGTGLPIDQKDEERSVFRYRLDPERWPKKLRRSYSWEVLETRASFNLEKYNQERYRPTSGVTPSDSGVQETSIETPEGVAWVPFRLEHAVSNPTKTVWTGAFDNYLCLFAVENFTSRGSSTE